MFRRRRSSPPPPSLLGALGRPLSRLDKLLLAGGALATAVIGLLAGAGWLV